MQNHHGTQQANGQHKVANEKDAFMIYVVRRFEQVSLTFIRTDSVSFSLLTILMATFFPVTQCTPSLTKPGNNDIY